MPIHGRLSGAYIQAQKTMAASNIRADMFSEFIPSRPASQETNQRSLRGLSNSASVAEPQAEYGHHAVSQSGEQLASDVLGDRSYLQEQPLLQLIQSLANHGGRMNMKALLASQELPKLDTLRQLDQLKKLDFIEITAMPENDMVQLTTLGRWAAKYAD